MRNIDGLRDYHASVKPQIKSRLAEFQKLKNASGDELFKELCFCILTANTSAQMGICAIEAAGDAIVEGKREKIRSALKSCGYRFPNKRSEYIAHNRRIKDELREKIDSCTDARELREHLVENVKGLGYKESSHFLRNVGFGGLAILDKHILNSLVEFGVITESSPPKNRKEYLEIEEKMASFAEEIGIGMDELDLLLWSRKTGKILK